MKSPTNPATKTGRAPVSPCDACAARREMIRRVLQKARAAMISVLRFAVRAQSN